MGKMLGFSAPKVDPVVVEPRKPAVRTEVDPNRGAAQARAKQRAAQLAKRRGRSSFRIDLAIPSSDETRVGINTGRK